MDNLEQLQYLEEHILQLAEHFGLENLIIALHNASCHGAIFEHSDMEHLLDDEDLHLKEWFKHVDALRELSRED